MNQTPEELGKKIRDARERSGMDQSATTNKKVSEGAGLAAAMRTATDLVAALVVGGALGYGIDQWLGSKPWGMIIFLIIGFIAGFVNIYRAQTGQEYQIGFKNKVENDKDITKE